MCCIFSFISADPPEFVNMPNNVEIPEDTELGAVIFGVHVKDKDVDFRSESLIYSMTDPYFDIDPNTGQHFYQYLTS